MRALNTNIGILNGKRRRLILILAFKMPKTRHLKCQNWCLKCQKLCLCFMEWTPGRCDSEVKKGFQSMVTDTGRVDKLLAVG